MTKTCFLCLLVNETPPLFETKHWKAHLALEQDFIGRSVVTLKRHAGDLAKLTPSEWKDLQTMIHASEKMTTKSFPSVDVFNWGCLMNNAFREKPYNPHVHFHVRPRHSKAITFRGKKWVDKEFGEHYPLTKKTKLSKNVREALESKLRRNSG